MTWLDILLGALLVIAFVRGWGRGIVAALMGMGSLLAALLITRVMAEPLVYMLDDRYGWLTNTREGLRQAAIPVLGPIGGEQLERLPDANRFLAETYDRLALTIWTVIFALILFAAITIGVNFLAKKITQGLDATPLALPNRLLGAGLNVVLTGVVAGTICAILLSMPGLNWTALSESRLGPALASAATSVVGAVLGILQANGSA